MKKILLSTVAFAGLTAGAMAAGLPMRAAPPPPVPVAAPVFTWTGFYAGVNIGWAFDGDENDRLGSLVTPNGPILPGRTFTVVPAAGGGSFLSRRGGDDGGLLGGGQVGYNMQFGSFVVGIEADAQAIDLGDVSGTNIATGFRTAATRPDALPAFGIAGVQPGATGNVFFARTGLLDRGDDTDVFGTVRGRLGMAFGQALIYATGGLAWKTDGDDDDNGRVGANPARAFYVSPAALARGNRILNRINNDGTDFDDFGFTVGGGIEYAFTNNISAKIEGLYVDFSDDNGGRNNRIVGVTNTGRAIRHTAGGGNDPLEFGLVRAGLNFRFGTW